MGNGAVVGDDACAWTAVAWCMWTRRRAAAAGRASDGRSEIECLASDKASDDGVDGGILGGRERRIGAMAGESRWTRED